jgi:hypothetical protein
MYGELNRINHATVKLLRVLFPSYVSSGLVDTRALHFVLRTRRTAIGGVNDLCTYFRFLLLSRRMCMVILATSVCRNHRTIS